MPTKKAKKISKLKFFTYKAADGIEYTMTEREKAFCDAYLVFGAKGVDAVYEAGYEPSNRKVAAVISSENLIKPNIFNYVNMKFEEHGLNDDNVMKQHLFLMNQDGDLGSKAKAVDMFYKKKGGYAPEKHEVTATVIEVIDYKKK